jgi:hypothetical protein
MENAHCEQRPGNGNVRGHRPAKGNGKTAGVVCPYCHESDEVIPILYGFPSHVDFRKADRGEVYLGGCEISPYGYYCKRDDREF